jgi:hypothetical protein
MEKSMTALVWSLTTAKTRRIENQHDKVCGKHAEQLPSATQEERRGKDASQRQSIQHST